VSMNRRSALLAIIERLSSRYSAVAVVDAR
jgi:hypothetical protein